MIDYIADIGANHDGSLERALMLIRLAAQAGATTVKFQHFRAEHIVSAYGFDALPPMAHQKVWNKPVVEVYRAAAIPWNWTPVLARACADAGVDFMSTPYDLDAVRHLDPYVKRWKVGSGDITYRALLEAVARTGKPIILSTGASTMPEVVKAHNVLLAAGAHEVATLQCVTDYTGGPSGNLRLFRSGMFDGLSDHTRSLPLAIGAVALGARIIERHFTDDSRRPGPDHGFAMENWEWGLMVGVCNETERLMGDGVKKVEPNETEARVVQRRCWRATRDLPAGWVLESSDLAALRPCPEGAMTPMTNVNAWTLTKPLASGEALMADGCGQGIGYIL